MTLIVHYPESGTVRTHRNLSQPQVNKLVTHISDCQDTVGEVHVRLTVRRDEEPTGMVSRGTARERDLAAIDFHAGEIH